MSPQSAPFRQKFRAGVLGATGIVGQRIGNHAGQIANLGGST